MPVCSDEPESADPVESNTFHRRLLLDGSEKGPPANDWVKCLVAGGASTVSRIRRVRPRLNSLSEHAHGQTRHNFTARMRSARECSLTSVRKAEAPQVQMSISTIQSRSHLQTRRVRTCHLGVKAGDLHSNLRRDRRLLGAIVETHRGLFPPRATEDGEFRTTNKEQRRNFYYS